MGTNLKTVIKSTIKKVAIFSVTILLGAIIIEFLRKFDLFYSEEGLRILYAPFYIYLE